MSVKKLQNFVERPLPQNQNIIKQVILVSDSKGNYLRRVDENQNLNFTYICRGGATFRQQFYNIKNKINTFSYSSHFLIWLGTCDLTQKEGRYITLRDKEGESDLNSIIYFIEQFVALFRRHRLSFSFIEIPPYSIVGWNKTKGHISPESFRNEDIILLHKIALVNDRIRQINFCFQGGVSPKFHLALCRSHRSSSYTRLGNINWNLFTDGIHPTQILAKYWLRSIVLQVLKSCV